MCQNELTCLLFIYHFPPHGGGIGAACFLILDKVLKSLHEGMRIALK